MSEDDGKSGPLTLKKKFDLGSDVLCCRISPDSTQLAGGCAAGDIKVFQRDGGDGDGEGKALVSHLVAASGVREAVTCIRYNPPTSAGDTANILTATYTTGKVRRWHTTSRQLINTLEVCQDALSSLDYNSDGSQIVVSGNDFTVRVFDVKTNQLLRTLGPGRLFRSAEQNMGNPEGHTNRVHSVIFNPADKNLCYSGGWDNTVQFWDIRQSRPVSHIYGPFLGGDALDVDPDTHALLTGSYRESESLQVWDLRSLKLVRQMFTPIDQIWIYGCQFGARGSPYAVCAGSKQHEVRIVDRERGKCLGRLANEKAYYSMDVSNDGSFMLAGAADKTLQLIELNP